MEYSLLHPHSSAELFRGDKLPFEDHAHSYIWQGLSRDFGTSAGQKGNKSVIATKI
jgi:hypothetical protein